MHGRQLQAWKSSEDRRKGQILRSASTKLFVPAVQSAMYVTHLPCLQTSLVSMQCRAGSRSLGCQTAPSGLKMQIGLGVASSRCLSINFPEGRCRVRTIESAAKVGQHLEMLLDISSESLSKILRHTSPPWPPTGCSWCRILSRAVKLAPPGQSEHS